MNDVDFQVDYVVRNAWRLLAMQDDNPLSPSYGCFDYAYWRDKTSEFPDARLQEAGAALALVSLPVFEEVRARHAAPGREVLVERFRSALRNWAGQQYRDGCWDEWYKGERGFAVTHFTMIAYGVVAWMEPTLLDDDDRLLLIKVMTRAGDWLLPRDDRVKTNHEAAAAAALALAWRITGEMRFHDGARQKLDDTLTRQVDEGWFPEVGGMDLGYCSVTLDYVMLYRLIAGDDTGLDAMRRLFAFVAPHIHPDFTVAAEAGLCLNPYLGRLGTGLLSKHDENARVAVADLTRGSAGEAGLATYLADDLHFRRWAYLPLLTRLLQDNFRSDAPGMEAIWPDGWTIREQSLIAAWHGGDWHLYFAPAGGGSIYLFEGKCLVAVDHGLSLQAFGKNWGAAGYDRSRRLRRNGEEIEVDFVLGVAKFFFPTFPQRLLLRLGSTTATGSRLMRKLIDQIRTKKKSAINQSSAPIAKKGGTVKITRRIVPCPDSVTIVDHLTSKIEFPPGSVRSNLIVKGARREISELRSRNAASLTVTKTFYRGGRMQIFVS